MKPFECRPLLAGRFPFPNLPPSQRTGGHQEPPGWWSIRGDPKNAITGPFRINGFHDNKP